MRSCEFLNYWYLRQKLLRSCIPQIIGKHLERYFNDFFVALTKFFRVAEVTNELGSKDLKYLI